MSENPKGYRESDGAFNGLHTSADIEELKNIKKKRLKAILEFARTETYVSQHALCDWLAERGLGCNQGQLSKDLDRLGMVPYIDRNGDKRLGRQNSILNEMLEERYVKILQEASLGVYELDSRVIIDTVPGAAQAVATIVESACWREVLAIYYGMSSVTILCSSERDADMIIDRIREGIL